jgi:hypothetical protein
MKNSLLLMAIAISACNSSVTALTYQPKYKVGDCAVMILNKNPESWEKQNFIVMRILAVGKEKYHAVTLDDACAYLISRGQHALCYESTSFESFDNIYPLKADSCSNLEDFPSYRKGDEE